MWIDLDGRGPLYLQIYQSLRRCILDGELPPCSRLPATRTLCKDLGVSRNVVLMAFEQLLAEGYVEGRVGAGTYVSANLPESMLRAEPPPASDATPTEPPKLSRFAERIARLRPHDPVAPPVGGELEFDFEYGESSPGEEMRNWRRVLLRAPETIPTRYAPAAGLPELRTAIARHVRSRGVRCESGQVVVVTGSQQALDLAARVLIDPGESVALEEPHYQGARHVFQSAGADVRTVPVDEQGLDPAALEALRPVPRLVYLTPSHQFPTGAVMPAARRLAVLEWAHRNDAFVLEDDYDGEYRYEGRPLEAVHGLDRRGRSVYVGTFSKVLFPALRLGFLVLPPSLVDTFVGAKWLADRHGPSLEQSALARYLDEGHFERHLRRTRVVYASRRRVLLEALEEHFGDRVVVQGANAGLHLVAWLPELEPRDVGALVERAAGRGVGVYPLDPYYLGAIPRAGLLLGFSSIEEEKISEGVRRLAEVIRVGAPATG